jgi:hypothetical protein
MATERLQRRINTLLDEADDAIANSDWELVLNRAQNVVALDPENPDALALIAAAERALGASAATSVERIPVDPSPHTPPTATDPIRPSYGSDLPSGLITYLFRPPTLWGPPAPPNNCYCWRVGLRKSP